MANEITLGFTFSVFKSGSMLSPHTRANTQQLGMVGTVVADFQMTVNTTATQIPFDSVTAAHWCVFTNLDATNNLTIGTANTITYATGLPRLHPGETMIIPVNDSLSTLYAIANSAACQLDVLLCQF